MHDFDQWKGSVELVALSDLDEARARELGWPALRRSFEALDASVVGVLGDVQVARLTVSAAKRLSEAGVATHVVGFDRRSDGWEA